MRSPVRRATFVRRATLRQAPFVEAGPFIETGEGDTAEGQRLFKTPRLSALSTHGMTFFDVAAEISRTRPS